ncbi:MAG TPA: YdcF family protein [Thermodesulfobacteriota bacterium]|nr:YdcF family protein [Thermodesulfobacteriota bacterium]
MKSRIRFYTAVFSFLALFVVYLFVDFLKADGIADAPVRRADCIVVLTGGKGRIERGMELYRQGTAGLVILSGVNEAADMDAIFFSGTGGVPREDIMLEKSSKSTYQNALEIRRIMEARGLKSMILITSSYHMKRAYRIFRRIMPAEVTIIPLKVSSPNFDEHRWWMSLGILVPEFMKFYWYELRFGLENLIA